MSKEFDTVESHTISTGRYCIADELIDAGDTKLRSCGSSDALAIYENVPMEGERYLTGFCYSCNQSFHKNLFHASSHAAEFGIEGGMISEGKEYTRLPKAAPLTHDEVKGMIKSIGYKSNNYRGIMDKSSQFYGHLTKLSPMGEVLARYYPETQDGNNWPSGYKCRNHPKDFRYGKVGLTGLACDLAGYVKFKDYVGHRDVLITGGEEDMVAAFQMLRESQLKKGQEDYAPVAVVSPTTGEGSAIQQIRKHYDWLCGFENIILGLDNDEAGNAAMNAIAEILPRDKVKIAHWTGKDPNKMLQDGNQKQFLSDWFNAVPYARDGIITSGEADDSIEEELLRPKMSLPPFMKGIQKAMAGGVPLGYIVNWIAESGIGKSTLVNEAIRHWVYNSPYKIGILSLELTGAQYMITMLSREVGHKINLIDTPEAAVEFVRRPDVMLARKHLAYTEDGESRFVILDEREGNLSEVKRQCEKLVNKYGCKVIIIDPIQDLFEGVPQEEQNGFIKWMKGMLKRGVTFNNVCHVKKSGNSSADKEGKRVLRELSEDDVHGIGAIVKSAGANIFMSRDKYSESEIEKNTTFPTIGKCRWTGITGKVDPWYYHLQSHTMYDLKEYFIANPDELPEGYDLDCNPYVKKRAVAGESKNGFSLKTKEDTTDIMTHEVF